MTGTPIRKRKLDARYAQPLIGLLTSATFALIMSGVLLVVNRGVVPSFFMIWMRSFGVAFLVAFPTSMVIVPLIRRLVAQVVELPQPQRPPPQDAVNR